VLERRALGFGLALLVRGGAELWAAHAHRI
jgi:hypothetical protein